MQLLGEYIGKSQNFHIKKLPAAFTFLFSSSLRKSGYRF